MLRYPDRYQAPNIGIVCAMLLASGCAPLKPAPGGPGLERLEIKTDNPLPDPELMSEADAAASVCRDLLENLREARPLLESLPAQLDQQARRIEAAASNVRPAPPPASADCPEIDAVGIDGKTVIGQIEWIYMTPPGRHYRARVDSGAETSSLSATDVVEFERDGDDWVRFTFEHDNDESTVQLELPIVRTALIRQAGVPKPERRVVVDMAIRLGRELQTTEFTLTDRSHMTYPVLLGRAFLRDLYVIDVSQSFTHRRYRPR
ncbi:MAG: ATP-dependent zinc protease [Pseudomonadota bacterium]